jgi:outer membrane protein
MRRVKIRIEISSPFQHRFVFLSLLMVCICLTFIEQMYIHLTQFHFLFSSTFFRFMHKFVRTVVAIATVFCGFLACSTTVSAQLKIGVVNTQTIIAQLPEAKKAEGQLQEMSTKVRDTLDIMSKELQEAFEQYQKQQGMMSPEGKQKEEDRINSLNKRRQEYQEEKRQELAKVQEMLLAPIRKRVSEAIETVAGNEKLSFMMEAGALLYADKTSDYTYKVLDQLNRGTNTGGATTTKKK